MAFNQCRAIAVRDQEEFDSLNQEKEKLEERGESVSQSLKCKAQTLKV